MKYFPYSSKIKIFNLVVLLIFNTICFAQSENQKLRLANALEKSQNFEEAIKLYQELENSSKTGNAAIQGIQNCLKGLMKYEDLVLYLENLLEKHASNDQYMNSLAVAYLLNSDKKKAEITWNALINKKKNDIKIYRMIAGSMIQQRLLDEAVEVYELALKNIKNQQVLHLDLANLYKSILNVEKATHHFLEYYGKYPKQKTFLERQILNLTKSDEQAEKVAGALKEYISENKNKIFVKDILAGLYIKSGKFADAFDIYKSLENLKNDGSYLFKFGKEAQKNGAYKFAIESFTKILENKKLSIHDKANFELAKTYYSIALNEQKSVTEYQPSQTILKAIQIFDMLILKNSITSFSDLSCLIIGDIYLDLYFDVDKSINYYSSLKKSFPRSKKLSEAIIKLGDCYLIKGDFENSKKTYLSNKDKKSYSLSLFKLAEIDYFQGIFSNALDKYNLILKKQGAEDSLANNVLERTIMINTFRSDSLNLKHFAHGELLVFQKKHSEAVEQFNTILKMQNNLSPNAGGAMADLLIKLEKYQDANAILSDLINQFHDYFHADEFLFKKATVEEKIGNMQQAFNLYQQLLNKYETSLYYERAREKARELNNILQKVSG